MWCSYSELKDGEWFVTFFLATFLHSISKMTTFYYAKLSTTSTSLDYCNEQNEGHSSPSESSHIHNETDEEHKQPLQKLPNNFKKSRHTYSQLEKNKNRGIQNITNNNSEHPTKSQLHASFLQTTFAYSPNSEIVISTHMNYFFKALNNILPTR